MFIYKGNNSYKYIDFLIYIFYKLYKKIIYSYIYTKYFIIYQGLSNYTYIFLFFFFFDGTRELLFRPLKVYFLYSYATMTFIV